jgi:hypothetical protein
MFCDCSCFGVHFDGNCKGRMTGPCNSMKSASLPSYLLVPSHPQRPGAILFQIAPSRTPPSIPAYRAQNRQCYPAPNPPPTYLLFAPPLTYSRPQALLYQPYVRIIPAKADIPCQIVRLRPSGRGSGARLTRAAVRVFLTSPPSPTIYISPPPSNSNNHTT